MNKAIFLDRDGTINVDYGYVHKYENFEFIDGVKDALLLLKNAVYKFILITNQSGIARGYFTEEEFFQLSQKIQEELKDCGAEFDGIYYCPHLNEGCDCRKPAVGLFYKAAQEHKIDFSKSYAIGDRMRDLTICQNEPVKGFLIGETEEIPDNIKLVDSLLEAAKCICVENLENI